MSRHAFPALLAVTFTLAWTVTGVAGKYNREVSVGDLATGWSALPGTDGKNHGLDDYGEAKAVAVVFTCNNCPVAVAYQDRLMKIASDYADQGVVLVAINVNKGEDLEAMKQRADEKGFNFPYLLDESQRSARAYGATCTPHAFLLDKERKIAYMGAIDDNWQSGEEAKTHYLRDAIDAVLEGKTAEVTEAKQVGCAIKWKN